MYHIQITNRARKELNQIKLIYQSAIRVALEDLKHDPYAGKPLIGEFKGYFSYKIGVYRIVYKLNKTDKIIKIITAGHRENVYNK